MDNIIRQTPPPLPKRKRTQEFIPIINKFSELLRQSEEIIKRNGTITAVIHIDDFELLKENFSFLQSLVSSGKYTKFYSEDYQCLKYVEDNLQDYTSITLSLIDDMKNQDRSYIDTFEFEKTSLEIPISYALWNPTLQETQPVTQYVYRGSLQPCISNVFTNISLEELKRIREIVLRLSEKYQGLSDLEKTILISNYLQNSVQYVIEGNVSEASDGIYITDSKGLEITDLMVSLPQTVLFDKFGKCNGIAHATTFLMNNPEINVNARSVFGCSHVWNIVEIEGKYYYVDNTWSVTRNQDRYEESLKARSFTSDYILFGSTTADKIGHHIPDTLHPKIEEEDFSKELIAEKQKSLVKIANFSGYEPPVFSSRISK